MSVGRAAAGARMKETVAVSLFAGVIFGRIFDVIKQYGFIAVLVKVHVSFISLRIIHLYSPKW